ncbi:sex comb on midleg-like protein 1 [Chionomys nivalis]|uniref:sex comb on midleg-like protein 1 n=1 Tax=Chionomys nivalis TaxID=269649 RepID=UPI00259924E4|nr:sex comb on midleg-like protein 1 [Chionomys nivalis]
MPYLRLQCEKSPGLYTLLITHEICGPLFSHTSREHVWPYGQALCCAELCGTQCVRRTWFLARRPLKGVNGLRRSFSSWRTSRGFLSGRPAAFCRLVWHQNTNFSSRSTCTSATLFYNVHCKSKTLEVVVVKFILVGNSPAAQQKEQFKSSPEAEASPPGVVQYQQQQHHHHQHHLQRHRRWRLEVTAAAAAAAVSEIAAEIKEPQPPEIRETEEPKAIVDIMNHFQVISKTVQRLEKKIDDMDNKVTKIYYSRARSFWRYPPFKLVSRRYNYLTSKRLKLQKESQVVHDDTFSYPQSYSPTSPVRTRDEPSFDVENDETIDYIQMYQYHDIIDNAQTFQNPDSIDNAQMFQNPDSIDSAQTYQYADSVDNTESIQNTENDAVFHFDGSLGVRCISSSPESNHQETPLSPKYTPQNYQQHCRFKRIPGSSTMTHYSDFENPNLYTTISSASTILKGSNLPRGELIPIRNPEMKRLALLEAQSTPVIDPNTFGLSSSCTKAVVRDLGKPLNWSVNDVITFLNRLDPPLADQLYSTIKEHDVDGKALLLLNTDIMIKYMRMKVGVALKLSSYIQKLKKGVNCHP